MKRLAGTAVSTGLCLGLTLFLCGYRDGGPTLEVRSIQSPAPTASLVPQLTALSGGRLALSWQQRLDSGGYRFAMSIRRGDRWSDVRTIASGPDLSMFHADLPGIAELPGGALLAYWEIKDQRDGDRYGTTIQTSVSNDEGKTWLAPVRPYGDSLAGQHSFLSAFPSVDGLGLVWLDAQQRSFMRHASMGTGEMGTGEMGSIGLRYAHLNGRGELTDETFIDPITCECCPTSAAVTKRGPVVVYRGRQEAPGTKPSEVRNDRATVRDIYLARFEDGKWSKPRLVHPDNWVINACPDNGPAVDASGEAVAVAWWTRSGDVPKVMVGFSRDAGDAFGPAIRVDGGKGEGQVTVTLLPGAKAAVVGWLEEGEVWARYVSSNGDSGPALALGPTPRHSRLPKWLLTGGRVTAAWTSQVDGVSRVEVSQLSF